MKVIKTKFKGLNIYKKKYFKDSRGYFQNYIRKKLLIKIFHLHVFHFQKNVIRGLHLQSRNAQGKYISVLKGKVLDVVVDLRKILRHLENILK